MDKVTHFEIPADKTERAKKFYSGVFGWKIEKVPMPPGAGEYHMISTVMTDKKSMPVEPGAINGGLMSRDGTSSCPVIVISVASIDSSLKKVEKAGGKVIMGKQTVMGMGLYARVRDTEGNIIGVWQDLKPGAH